jgi:hypothetical protein
MSQIFRKRHIWIEWNFSAQILNSMILFHDDMMRGLHLKKIWGERVWNLSKGRGAQFPNPTFFSFNFGSIEIKIWGRSRAIDIYFCFQTLCTNLLPHPSSGVFTLIVVSFVVCTCPNNNYIRIHFLF